jgi:hypothetical protein
MNTTALKRGNEISERIREIENRLKSIKDAENGEFELRVGPLGGLTAKIPSHLRSTILWMLLGAYQAEKLSLEKEFIGL